MYKRYAVGVAAVLAVAATAVQGQELDEFMSVQATVTAGCSNLEVPVALDMGTLSQGEAGTAAGDIVVTCGTGVDYLIAFEGGGFDEGGTRRMNDEFDSGTEFLPYIIVSDSCAGTEEVGTTNTTGIAYTPQTAYPAGSVLSATGDGSAQSHTVCARVDANDTMTAAPTNYTDQVRVVVAF